MSQNIIFEELDEATRGYLMAVRDAGGAGAPGFFAVTNTAFPGCSLLSGLFLIPFTLVATLTNWMDVVYGDPIKVAFIQTAGLLLGGWLFFAYFRMKGSAGSKTTAGHWVYMDARNLYIAYRERVTIIPSEEVMEANYTHNYNNGNYQNSLLRLKLGGRNATSFTLVNELRAEQFASFVNYLAWARGGESAEIGKLSAASLGAVACYYARNDVEPKTADGAIDESLLALNITEVPDEPSRDGRALPSFLPYIVMIVAAVAIFSVMAFLVNPPIRDDAIYAAVIEHREPRFLRAYLIDPRNTLHRFEVLSALAAQYQGVMQFVSNHAEEPALRSGMYQILGNLSKESEQPVVSLRVRERSPENLAAGNAAKNRVKKLREGVVGGDGIAGLNRNGILDIFAAISPAIRPPEGVIFTIQPPPIGHQLIAFVEPPEDATHAHFEIIYEFKPAARPDEYLLSVTVEIRETIDGAPIATYATDLSTFSGDERSLDSAIDVLRANIVRWMVGKPEVQP
jgi:hypothetical protein